MIRSPAATSGWILWNNWWKTSSIGQCSFTVVFVSYRPQWKCPCVSNNLQSTSSKFPPPSCVNNEIDLSILYIYKYSSLVNVSDIEVLFQKLQFQVLLFWMVEVCENVCFYGWFSICYEKWKRLVWDLYWNFDIFYCKLVVQCCFLI